MAGKKGKPQQASVALSNSGHLMQNTLYMRNSPWSKHFMTPDGGSETKTRRRKALYQAVKDGITAQAKQCLAEDSRDVNQLDNDGMAPIHYAARYNRSQVIPLLAKYGCDLNAKNGEGVSPLHVACQSNSPDVVTALAMQGVFRDIMDSQGQTPLHCASRKGLTPIVETLLRMKSNTNVKDQDEVSPLHLAALSGNTETCALLLDHGGDLGARDMNGSTPLMYAATEGNHAVMELFCYRVSEGHKGGGTALQLLEAQDSEGHTSLLLAVESGQKQAVEVCLKYGVNVNATKSRGVTALHMACTQGHDEIIWLLLNRGANINSVDLDYATPMHRASQYGQMKTANLLVSWVSVQAGSKLLEPTVPQHVPQEGSMMTQSWGADLNAKDEENCTPFLRAVMRGQTSMALFLLQQKVDVGYTTVAMETCIHLAVRSQNVETLQVLLEGGCSYMLEKRDCDDQTPLHYAVKILNPEMLTLLLRYRVNLAAKDHEEKSALHIAAEYGNKEAVEMLLGASSAQTNDRDQNGQTPLMLACVSGWVDVVKSLVSTGADVSARDDNGRTALMWTGDMGHIQCMQVLLHAGTEVVDALDRYKNTALHLASKSGHMEAVELLLHKHKKVNSVNKFGQTPLDLAVDSNHKEVAIALLTSARWKEAMETRDAKGYTPFKKLIKKMPEAAEVVLEQCMTYSHSDPLHPDLEVTYDYHYIDPGPDDPASRSTRYLALNTMVEYETVKLLEHPVVSKLLAYKWSKVGRIYFLIQVVLYLLYMCFLIAWLLLNSSDIPGPKSNTGTDGCLIQLPANVTNRSLIDQFKKQSAGPRPVTDPLPWIANIILYSYVILAGLHELVKVALMRLKYFGDPLHYFMWLMFVCSLMFVYPPLVKPCAGNWKWGVAAVICAWINLMTYLRLNGILGMYVSMFLSVLFSLMKVTMIFSFLIVGFGMAFYVMLKSQDAYKTVWLSMAKVLVMMIGEFDYIDTFVTSDNNPYHDEAIGIFAFFILLVPIALANLLIGIAVGDINNVKAKAKLRKISLQVSLVYTGERMLLPFIQRYIHKTKGIVRPNSGGPAITHRVNRALFGKAMKSLRWLKDMRDPVAENIQAQSARLQQVEDKLQQLQNLVEDIHEVLAVGGSPKAEPMRRPHTIHRTTPASRH